MNRRTEGRSSHGNPPTRGRSRGESGMAELFDALLSELAERTADRLADRMDEVAPRESELPPIEGLGVEPLRAYKAEEVARMLGTKRVASVYEIPEEQLPRVRRIGSSIGYLGINVLAYMHGLPPVDVEAMVESYRKRIMDDRPKVLPLRSDAGGRTRLL